MAPSTDVVLAGSKAFALALFAPVTERVGSRPRIAPEPQQAVTLCAGSSGLLLVEFSEPWLPVLQQLRAQVPGLRVVAALPQGQEAAALALAPLGVEAVPWDGQAAPILAAVTKLLGPGAVASPPAPQGVTRPPIAPAAAAAPAAARSTAPQLARAPATTPAGGTPAAPMAPRVPATTPPRPIPAAPVAARAPATTPAAGTPAAPPLARPPATTPAGGTPAAAAPKPAPAAAPPAAPPTAPPTPPAASQASTSPATDLFDDLEPAEPAPEAPSAPVLAPYTLPPAAEAPAHAGDWPSGVPSEDEAESALVLYTRGKLRPDAPLAAVTRDAVKGMSELERQVVGGAELPFDAQPIYKAAVLRLRVAAALATVPTEQARVDDAAVQALLAELDGVLALVNPLAMAAPPEHQPALEAVRNALVREAVDFSEAAHRVAAGGAPPAPEASARAVQRKPVADTRVLKDQAGALEDAPEERQRRAPVVILLLVLLLGGGYHAWNYLNRSPVVAPLTLEGAPAGTTTVTTGAGLYLVAIAGARIDPADLERFKRQEERKGNSVREVAPGRWIIESSASPKKGATP